MVKKAFVLVLGLAALILNPFVARSLFEPNFSFGAGEMRAAVEGRGHLDDHRPRHRP